MSTIYIPGIILEGQPMFLIDSPCKTEREAWDNGIPALIDHIVNSEATDDPAADSAFLTFADDSDSVHKMVIPVPSDQWDEASGYEREIVVNVMAACQSLSEQSCGVYSTNAVANMLSIAAEMTLGNSDPESMAKMLLHIAADALTPMVEPDDSAGLVTSGPTYDPLEGTLADLPAEPPTL